VSRPLGTAAVAFANLALVYGVWYAYGVFLVALLHEFGWSRSVLAGAFSIFTLVHGGLGYPLGGLVDRLGPRRVILAGGVVLALGLVLDSAVTRPWHLYLTFGVVTAVGIGCAGWVPTVILVQRWFPERMGTALGFVSAGVGFGIVLVVPACQWLIETVGWRWAFRVAALGATAWILPATLWLVAEPRGPMGPAQAPVPAAGLALAEAARTRQFWLLALLQASVSFSNQMLQVHQVAFLVDHRIPPLVAASVVSAVGISSMLGKAGGGWLSDLLGRRILYTAGIAAVAGAIGVLGLVSLRPSASMAFGYAVLLGVGYAIPAAITPVLVRDVFPGRHFGAIFGTLQVANALGGASGPWVAGRIFDATGSYGSAFATALAVLGLAAGALWAIRRHERRPAPDGG
jgi:MFS family permease